MWLRDAGQVRSRRLGIWRGRDRETGVKREGEEKLEKAAASYQWMDGVGSCKPSKGQ